MEYDIYVSHEQLIRMYEFYSKGEFEFKREEVPWHSFYRELGMVCVNRDGCFFNTATNESFLRVIDKKKWLLLKLKYGI